VRELIIDGTRIADDEDCYVIAEVGHNHGGSVEKCKELFEAAKWSGANAVKLQKRENKSLYTEEMYNSPYNSEHSYGRTYGEHREALEFDWDQYVLLKCYAEAIGLTFFATAFDVPSADFLAALKVPAIKIASGDLTNTKLLDHVGRMGIPIIFSTGGGDIKDVERAENFLFPPDFTEDTDLAILHCTSGYPASYDELNLNVLGTFREHFPCVVGWSGHDTGIAMSLEPHGFRAMVENLKLCKRALGDGIKRRYASEVAPLAKQWKNQDGKIDGLIRQLS
jgi:sialic acid synthase